MRGVDSSLGLKPYLLTLLQKSHRAFTIYNTDACNPPEESEDGVDLTWLNGRTGLFAAGASSRWRTEESPTTTHSAPALSLAVVPQSIPNVQIAHAAPPDPSPAPTVSTIGDILSRDYIDYNTRPSSKNPGDSNKFSLSRSDTSFPLYPFTEMVDVDIRKDRFSDFQDLLGISNTSGNTCEDVTLTGMAAIQGRTVSILNGNTNTCCFTEQSVGGKEANLFGLGQFAGLSEAGDSWSNFRW